MATETQSGVFKPYKTTSQALISQAEGNFIVEKNDTSDNTGSLYIDYNNETRLHIVDITTLQELEQIHSEIDTNENNIKQNALDIDRLDTQPDWEATDTTSHAYIQNKIPITNGSGTKSIVINEGDAVGDYSWAGGTTDTTLVEDLLGSLASSVVDLEKSQAAGAMSMAYGAGTKAITSGSMALGVQTSAGCKGFYWHSFDFTTTDSDGNVTPTIILSTKQAPKYTYTLPIVGEKVANETSTWTSEAANILANWNIGDLITIVNDKKYGLCATIQAIDSTNGKITVNKLPFTESSASSSTVLAALFEDFSIYCPANPLYGIINLGFGSLSLGYNNKASSSFSTVLGYDNIAGSNFSLIAGKENKGAYGNLVAGVENFSSGDCALVTGKGNTSYGIGSAITGAKNTVYSDYGHAEGTHNTVGEENSELGWAAHAEGDYTSAIGDYSHSEGYSTTAKGLGTHVEGGYSVAIGNRAHAQGFRTIALGADSHTEGRGSTRLTDIEIDITTATNDEIYNTWLSTKFTLAKGLYSHAEGFNTLTFGDSSHAEGARTVTRGNYGHAEGNGTEASGSAAHAQGSGSVASGGAAHAEGKDTIAAGQYQHVQGKWNVEDAAGTYAHIVGGGTSTSVRKNIHTIDWNGNAWYAGTLKIGGTSYNNASEVALKSDVENMVDLSSNQTITGVKTFNNSIKIGNATLTYDATNQRLVINVE